LKLDESQRKRLESLCNTAYGVVKAGKPFSDYELICEIQVRNGLDPQGLVTIFFPPSTLKTTREESKMSNFHTTLFQNSFVLVS
jgi:hypothetical protein